MSNKGCLVVLVEAFSAKFLVTLEGLSYNAGAIYILWLIMQVTHAILNPYNECIFCNFKQV